MFDIRFLRVVHDLHGRIVLHQRQIAIHIVGRFTDWLADELACGIVIGFECFYQLAVFRREGFFIGDVVNRPSFRFRLRHLPFTAVITEL
ncbi:Uncharacterised protein [Shigella sonnei]|nr:Uncharacterised protein [Shigella sonnei]CSF17533.1 Uncharacterised protein [Shigella sonnei]CSF27602.1 Uncharacterised protein [Shigella sonnei]CSO97712.1 Uncharacterised protein [Shigella sonnei]CSP57738.1 Uncharacterised protein [Shigella sonnei]